MKNICSSMVKKEKKKRKHAIFVPTFLRDKRWHRREENGGRKENVECRWRSWKDWEHMRMAAAGCPSFLYYHKSKKNFFFSMVQKVVSKKRCFAARGRVGGRAVVFMPSPQSPPPLLQLPGGKTVQVWVVIQATGWFWCRPGISLPENQPLP